MSGRRKLSCDYERPVCRKVATQRILARKVGEPHIQHESQYCDQHEEIVSGQVPAGWMIVATFPIERGVEA